MVVVKNFLAKIIYILIKDGHFTATSAACLSALSGYLFKLSVPATIHLIPFLGSEAIYSFNRYKEKKQDGLEKNKEDLLRKKNIFYPFLF